MPKYLSYRYIFPPRPKNAIPDSELSFWDNGSLVAQPKLNGSNCVIFTNGVKFIAMNRHNQRLTNFNLSDNELKDIYRGEGWMILNGEYMNKSKNDANGQIFNHKLVIFDILVYNGVQTIGMDFVSRVELLNKLYPSVNHDGYINKVDNTQIKYYHLDHEYEYKPIEFNHPMFYDIDEYEYRSKLILNL